MKHYVGFTVLVAFVLVAAPALALPSSANVPFELPGNANEVAPGVFSLGSAVDPETGKVVEGYAIVHPRENFHHRNGHGGGPGGGGDNGGGGNNKGGGDNKCYAEIAKGAVWKVAENWSVNPSNTEGLAGDFVLSRLVLAIDEWEQAVEGGANIFGDGFVTLEPLVADTVAPDRANEVYFGDVATENAIAVTITWGFFSGPPGQRELVEWDMVFDQADFDWSGDGSPGTMDFENIAQHELGHALGLSHPDDSCTEETMFRFASEGETKKRTLNAGDIAGVNHLY